MQLDHGELIHVIVEMATYITAAYYIGMDYPLHSYVMNRLSRRARPRNCEIETAKLYMYSSHASILL